MTYIHTHIVVYSDTKLVLQLSLFNHSSLNLFLSYRPADTHTHTHTHTHSAMNTAVLADMILQLEMAGVSQMFPLR